MLSVLKKRKLKSIDKRRIGITSLYVIALVLAVEPAFAAVNPLKTIGDWIKDGGLALLQGVLFIIGLVMLFQRDWIKLLGFIGAVVIIGIFTDWTTVKSVSGWITTQFLQ